MEAKEYGNVGKKAIWFVKSLLCGYIVTGFLLLILALMLYFVLLMLITLGVYHAFQGNVTNIAVTFLLCAGGGMLGGMIA